ncbi:MAG: tryptophan--tRNA ligase [Elusimicrobia bacterium]|nr:tryptophan--tRNA ligase [Elusimicrobiota bacterium]
MKRKIVMSGMRPTGRLHLGNLWGALRKWVAIQDEHECYFAVADWHMLTTAYDRTEELDASVREMVLDWLAAGLDPARCVIFRQSRVPEHAELFLLLSMVTPLSWLENNPTWKEQLQELSKTKHGLALGREALGGAGRSPIAEGGQAPDASSGGEADEGLRTHGFLGYPVLQAADILIYDADLVPVGQDQLPHLELSREIARRFNSLFGLAPGRQVPGGGGPSPLAGGGKGGAVLVEPRAMPTETPKLLGTDGRKMSKSYGNTIDIFEEPAGLKAKVGGMYTDPTRARATDPGHPEPCPENPPGCSVYALHKLYNQGWEARGVECREGRIGCVACKGDLLARLEPPFSEFRARRAAYDAKAVDGILEEGTGRARLKAAATLDRVRRAMRLV